MRASPDSSSAAALPADVVFDPLAALARGVGTRAGKVLRAVLESCARVPARRPRPNTRRVFKPAGDVVVREQPSASREGAHTAASFGYTFLPSETCRRVLGDALCDRYSGLHPAFIGGVGKGAFLPKEDRRLEHPSEFHDLATFRNVVFWKLGWSVHQHPGAHFSMPADYASLDDNAKIAQIGGLLADLKAALEEASRR